MAEATRVEAVLGGASRDEIERRLVVVGEENPAASRQGGQAGQSQPAADLEGVEVASRFRDLPARVRCITASARRYAPGQRYAQYGM